MSLHTGFVALGADLVHTLGIAGQPSTQTDRAGVGERLRQYEI